MYYGSIQTCGKSLLASCSLLKVVLATTCTNLFSLSFRSHIVHEEKICSLLKRLEAMLTDDRTGTTSGEEGSLRF